MKYGKNFSTAHLHRAPGTSHHAAERDYSNLFDLAADGGTAEALKIAHVGPGVVAKELLIESSANISGINFTVGTAADPDKYGTTTAGPAANGSKIIYPPLALGLDPTTEAEDIILTPSGALPGAGTIRTTFRASHR